MNAKIVNMSIEDFIGQVTNVPVTHVKKDIDEQRLELNEALQKGLEINYRQGDGEWLIWDDEGRGKPELGNILYEWVIQPKLPGTPFNFDNLPHDAIFFIPEGPCNCGSPSCKHTNKRGKGRVQMWEDDKILLFGSFISYRTLALLCSLTWDGEHYYPAVVESLKFKPS